MYLLDLFLHLTQLLDFWLGGGLTWFLGVRHAYFILRHYSFALVLIGLGFGPILILQSLLLPSFFLYRLINLAFQLFTHFLILTHNLLTSTNIILKTSFVGLVKWPWRLPLHFKWSRIIEKYCKLIIIKFLFQFIN